LISTAPCALERAIWRTKDGDINSFLVKFILIVAEHFKHIQEMKQ